MDCAGWRWRYRIGASTAGRGYVPSAVCGADWGAMTGTVKEKLSQEQRGLVMRSRAGASPTPATTRSESMSQPMRRFPAAPRLRRRIADEGLKEGNDAGERQASKLNDRYQRIEINLHKGNCYVARTNGSPRCNGRWGLQSPLRSTQTFLAWLGLYGNSSLAACWSTSTIGWV